MTQENTNKLTLQEYNQEIQPALRTLFKKQEIIKEWAADDTFLNQKKAEIKAIQEEMKKYIEETESELTREINDIKTDVKLAVKSAAKASGYKPAELNAYFTARAKEAVEKTLDKAELFSKLNTELL